MPDPLDPLLDRWKEPDPPRRSLAPEVWRRVALEDSRRRERRSPWANVDLWFSRPSFAAMFVACCALLGLFLAEVRVNHRQSEYSAELARSYLQLIDPLLGAKPAVKLQ
jgi:type VI protein secretion system component VasK